MCVFLTILFVIWPFGTLPLVLYLMYCQKKYAYYFFGIFIALFTMYYPPVGDQYRYWLIFQDPISLFDIDFGSEDGQWARLLNLIYPISSMIKYCGGNFEHVRFILILFTYSFSFNFFWNQTLRLRTEVSRKKYFFIALFFLLSLPVAPIMTGFRWGTAVIFFWLAASYFVIDRKIKAAVFATLAMFFHFAIVPCIALFALCMYVKNIIWKRPGIVLLAAVLISIFLELCIAFLLKFPFFDLVRVYIESDGAWRIGELPYEMSFLSKIGFFFADLMFYIYLIVVSTVIFKYKKNNINTDNSYPTYMFLFTFVLIIIFVIFWNFYAIAGRLKSLIILFASSAVMMAVLKKYMHINKKALLLYGLFIAFFFTFPFLSYKKALRVAGCHRFCYSNLFTIITNTYSEKWISENVNDDSSIIAD